MRMTDEYNLSLQNSKYFLIELFGTLGFRVWRNPSNASCCLLPSIKFQQPKEFIACHQLISMKNMKG
jgi:hypothetical protein